MKKSKKSRNKKETFSFSSIIMYSCIALIVVSVFCSIYDKVIEIKQKEQEITRLNEQYNSIVREKEKLSNTIDSPEEMNRYQIEKAREYGYCFPDEKIFYAFY